MIIGEFKATPPYPFLAKITLSNNNIINSEIFSLEFRGMIVHLKTPTLKAGDRVTVEFLIPENEPPPIIEKSQIIKLFVQMQNSKPTYFAEIHFLDPHKDNSDKIEKFLHQVEVERIAAHKNKRKAKKTK